MKVKMRKMLMFLIITVFTITPVFVFASTNKKTIKVTFNKANIKVDGSSFNGNRMVYNNKIYLPIESIAKLFNMNVYHYEKTKTTYIGQVPTGEVPKDVVDSWKKIKQPDKNKKETLISNKVTNINAVFNSIGVKIHGEKMKTDNILYNNIIFVSLEEVCKILETNCNYYKPTSTTYVGMIPQNEVPYDVYKKWFPNTAKDLKSKPATGEMAGWQKLIGHEYESIADIYYKLDGDILQVELKDIRKVDLNRIVEWTNDDGIKIRNRVGDIYALFCDFSPYTTDWFRNKFGKLYEDWMLVSAIKAENIVSDYLEETGQLEKQNNITLTPDAEYKTIEPEKKSPSAEEIIRNIENSMKNMKNK
ncbi:stalk domain-containing protein [uncultured Clostridium sp.]|uniref:stalk domain-containing protein n=1 Tax=uncultured Clostridium sp. TaxID=59620 RepID=UPI0028ED317B|nr:stalk domain-containing protein [uncultured Clostridium sp.]